MGFDSIDQIIQAVKAKKVKKKCAVVIAESRHTLEAVLSAYRDGIIEPLLIGEEAAIRSLLEEMAWDTKGVTIVPAAGPDAAVMKAAALVHEGKADLIMKGGIETWTLMKIALSRKSGLVTGKIVSGFNVLEFPTYHKPLAYTDGGITLYPDLAQKKLILENAVMALRKYGLMRPKVAALAAVEFVDPRMPETVDANELKKMNKRGEIKDCIVEGPITYDIAVSHEAARSKGFDSPVAGEADLLLFPDITSANLAMKTLLFSGQIRCGFFTVGTKVPIIMTSRANTAEEKYLSIAFAVAGDWEETGS